MGEGDAWVRLRSARKVRTRSFCANPLVDMCSRLLSPDQSIIALCVETLQNPISGLIIDLLLGLDLSVFALCRWNSLESDWPSEYNPFSES
jgi:hypothetical protein